MRRSFFFLLFSPSLFAIVCVLVRNQRIGRPKKKEMEWPRPKQFNWFDIKKNRNVSAWTNRCPLSNCVSSISCCVCVCVEILQSSVCLFCAVSTRHNSPPVVFERRTWLLLFFFRHLLFSVAREMEGQGNRRKMCAIQRTNLGFSKLKIRGEGGIFKGMKTKTNKILLKTRWRPQSL